MKKIVTTLIGAGALAAALCSVASPASASPIAHAAPSAKASTGELLGYKGHFVVMTKAPSTYVGVDIFHDALEGVDIDNGTPEQANDATSRDFTFPAIGKQGPVKSEDGTCMTSSGRNGDQAWMAPCTGEANQQFEFAHHTVGENGTGSWAAGAGYYLRSVANPNEYFTESAKGQWSKYVSVIGTYITPDRFDPTWYEEIRTAPVAITSPTNESTTGQKPQFKGTGEPSAIVTVTDHTGQVLCTAAVAANGTWNCTSAVTLSTGAQLVTATQTVGESVTTSLVRFNVQAATAELKVALGAIDHENKTVTMGGEGEPGATITVTTPTGKQTAIVTAKGTWTLKVTGLAVGENKLPVTQTVNGKITDRTSVTAIVDALETPLADPLAAGGALILAASTGGLLLARRRARTAA